MYGDEGLADILDLHTQEELTAEVEGWQQALRQRLRSSRRVLIALGIFTVGAAVHVLGQWRLTHGVQELTELLLRAVKEEAQAYDHVRWCCR